jgi:hypothetical protein
VGQVESFFLNRRKPVMSMPEINTTKPASAQQPELLEPGKGAPEPKEKDNPWGTLGLGVFLIACGIGAYFYFAHLEQKGGNFRAHALIVLVYSLLGKLGVFGLFGAIGGLMLFIGLKDLLKGKS